MNIKNSPGMPEVILNHEKPQKIIGRAQDYHPGDAANLWRSVGLVEKIFWMIPSGNHELGKRVRILHGFNPLKMTPMIQWKSGWYFLGVTLLWIGLMLLTSAWV